MYSELVKNLRHVEEGYAEKHYSVGEVRVCDMAKDCADALESLTAENERLTARNKELECAYSAYDGSALERADQHIELQEKAIHDLKTRAEKAEAERDAAVEDIKANWLCRACEKREKGKEWAWCKHGDFVTDGERVVRCSHFEWRGTKGENG